MNLREYDYNEQGLPTECRYVNSAGTVLLCSDRDLTCRHLGQTVSADYVEKVYLD